MTHWKHLVMLGPPGVGKGTYAMFLARRFGLVHLSTGDIVRREIRNATPEGKLLRETVASGGLVPDAIVSNLLFQKLASVRAEGKGFILDGFPRTRKQVDVLFSEVGEEGLDAAVHLSLPEKVILQKLLARRECPKCRKGFNVCDYNDGNIVLPTILPVHPSCRDCPQEFTKRQDDDAEVIKQRLRIHNEEEKGVIDSFRQKGILRCLGLTRGIEITEGILEEAVVSCGSSLRGNWTL